MRAIATWERYPEPGVDVAYRIVTAYAWLPLRIEGRWHWRIHYFALQAVYLDESPPTPWLTVERALEPGTLVCLERERSGGLATCRHREGHF